MELPSAPPSVQLDEGPTSHVLRLYKRKKEQGTVFIEVIRFQLSRLQDLQRPSLSANKITRRQLLQ